MSPIFNVKDSQTNIANKCKRYTSVIRAGPLRDGIAMLQIGTQVPTDSDRQEGTAMQWGSRCTWKQKWLPL